MYMLVILGSMTTGQLLGAYSDVLAHCEITRVLLLMLLQVSPALSRHVCVQSRLCVCVQSRGAATT